MQADEIAEGAYVKPRQMMRVNGKPRPRLYEIAEADAEGAVLRDCSSLDEQVVARSSLLRKFDLVIPEADTASLAA